MMRTVLICLLTEILTTTIAHGEGLACLNTFDNRFVIFDRGKLIYQDHNPAREFWVGHNYIAFVDYMNSLRIWYDGHAKEVWKGAYDVYSYDSMLIWDIAGTIRCWQNGQIHYVANRADFYRANESTIVFFDKFQRQLFVWHDGKSFLLDENQIDFPFISISISRKTVAWLTPNFEFKLYFSGQMRSITFYEPNLQYITGENFCLLNNSKTNCLELITPDTEIILESQPAKWWKTSYKNFCYLNHRNDFISNINDKQILTINSQMPSIVQFTTKGLFFEKNQQIAFYQNGVVHRVVDYIPNIFHAFDNTFYFKNNSGFIEAWEDNQSYTTSIPPEAMVKFFTDVILVYQANRPSFYYKNQYYEIR
ncbi:MAG TPA: hypothetical protein PK990_03325 [Salinivirgaceae bacterium]|nr:hypothetical protein [Salinivirgaceae bacterium]